MQKVKVTQDESGHWYIIPNELYEEFLKDSEDEDFIDDGHFDNKYGKYRTGGDINLVQLYIEPAKEEKTTYGTCKHKEQYQFIDKDGNLRCSDCHKVIESTKKT